VGAVRKNKRELPVEYTTIKNYSVFSSYFGFNENK